MKTKLYEVYEPDEIIRRLIRETAPLDGPSGYPVSIRYEADNSTGPPMIYFNLLEGEEHLFGLVVDNDTTIGDFDRHIFSVGGLREYVSLCLKAIENKTSFDEEREKVLLAKGLEIDDMPF